MLLVLNYNILSWTITTGILKGWTFLVLFVVFISCYLAHKVGFHLILNCGFSSDFFIGMGLEKTKRKQ